MEQGCQWIFARFYGFSMVTKKKLKAGKKLVLFTRKNLTFIHKIALTTNKASGSKLLANLLPEALESAALPFQGRCSNLLV